MEPVINSIDLEHVDRKLNYQREHKILCEILKIHSFQGIASDVILKMYSK